jgi:hypothetical protein
MFQHPARDAASARDGDAGLRRTGIRRRSAAGAGQFEFALGIDEEKRRGLDLHDATRHIENGGQQFLGLGDGIDQGAHLDKAFVEFQLSLERGWGRRHCA